MGYRSDVHLAVPANTLIPTAVAELLDVHADHRYRHPSGAMLFVFDGIKWYEEYPEIAAIERWLGELETYNLIRIGDDCNDIEHQGDWRNTPFSSYVSRQIISHTDDCTEIDTVVATDESEAA